MVIKLYKNQFFLINDQFSQRFSSLFPIASIYASIGIFYAFTLFLLLNVRGAFLF